MSKLSPTLQSVWRTITSSAEPERIFNSTARSTRFGVFTLQRVTSYMMSSTNYTTRLSVASDISTDKLEMGRSDWSSVRTHGIKLYNKFGMVTDCSFIKLPVGAMELTTWHLRKSISRQLLLYNTHVGISHQLLRLLLGDLTLRNRQICSAS